MEMKEPSTIGDFREFIEDTYHDRIIGKVVKEVEENGLDINRRSYVVPDYDQVWVEKATIECMRCRESPIGAFLDQAAQELGRVPEKEGNIVAVPEQSDRAYRGDASLFPLPEEMDFLYRRSVVQIFAGVSTELVMCRKKDSRGPYDHTRQWFRVKMYYNCLTDAVTDMQVAIYDKNLDQEGRKLSRALVPYLPPVELECEANWILYKYYPEAIENPEKLNGEELASRLGLHIRYANLGDSVHNHGRFYFSRQKVPVFGKYGCAGSITVEPLTILLDENLRDDVRQREDAIVHECIHYLEHSCFFFFQKTHHEEMAYLASDGPVPGQNSAIDRVERQASQLTYRVRMPKEFTQKMVESCLQKYAYLGKVKALNRTVHDLADYFHVSYESAKNRMRDFGCCDVIGIMNFVDGRYADDYDAAGDITHRYAISLRQLAQEYERNPILRKLFYSGAYIYAGGYVVKNSPQSVYCDRTGYHLTEDARRNISAHCIGFIYKRERGQHPYDPYSLHRDHDEHEDDVRTDVHLSIDQLMQLDQEYQQTAAKPAVGFAQKLDKYMSKTHTTDVELVEDTGIALRSIQYYLAGTQTPKLEYAVAICVALGLTPTECRDLMNAAHFAFEAAEGGQYGAYSFILEVMARDYSVYEVNKYLRERNKRLDKKIPLLPEPNTK